MLIRSLSYVINEDDEAQADRMGIEYEPVLNPIVIVSDHIVAYWPHENGVETIVDTKGDVYHVTMPFEEFDRIFTAWKDRYTARIN